ncbi:hypothetical protein A8709_13465 [Paenibacillus pectinilyticus]|uniref:GH16 domain-containing protein n=1 Tax=Paenibacillus pectinilyticus TaxID=512399 RepID=A0A1C1A3I0_9BACL|nr:family 16 glycosylhydrolase [Paenibacillus pectinilyticus]OCT15113.1 hypothetical protein A8709_13465 [Paenibacillus pectinilyticus]
MRLGKVLGFFGFGALLVTALTLTAGNRADASAPAGYSLVWQEDFNGSSLNEDEWNYRQNSLTDEGNVSVSGGVLQLDMTRTATGFRGAGITSKRTFGYGYYEINAKWDFVEGFHPSAWTQIWDGQLPKPNNDADATEIDLFEQQADGNINAGYFNWHSNAGADTFSYASPRVGYTGDYSLNYHTYGVDYTSTYMAFYKDGVKAGQIDYSGTTANKNSPMVFYLSTIVYGSPDPSQPTGYVYGKYYVDNFKYYSTTGTVPVTSPAAPAVHNPLRSDNFEIGAYKWNLLSGSWSTIIDGSKVLNTSTTSGESVALYSDYPVSSSTWSDSSVQAKLKLLGTTGSAGVIGRYQNGDYYYLRLNPTNNSVELLKVKSSVSTILSSVAFPVSTGTYYGLKLYMNGSTLKGYVNGVELVSGFDEDFTLGSSGVKSYNVSFSADDFLATRVMYSDDLNAGNADKWSPINGSWSVISDGTSVLKNAVATGEALAYANSAKYANAWVSANIKLHTTGGYASVIGRYTDINNFYMLRLDKAAGKLFISKKGGGSVTDLASVTLSINTNQWYRLELSMVGGVLKGYLDGEEKLSYSDASPLPAGRVGVRGYGESFSVDNLYVEAR